MATIKRFEDLEIWRLSRLVSKKIHKLLEDKKDFKDFGLKNQIFNSSGSIMDNIAEGFERNGRKEFIQFLSIAKGSSGECRSQIYRLFDNGIINDNEFKELISDVEFISGKIQNFISYLNKTEYKGTKFSEPEVEYFVSSNFEH